MTNSEMSVPTMIPPTMSPRDWFALEMAKILIAKASPHFEPADLVTDAFRVADGMAEMLAARTPPPPPDDALRVAAKALIAKIDKVQASPEYIAAWVCVATHQPYKGEQWGNELDALRAALAGGKA